MYLVALYFIIMLDWCITDCILKSQAAPDWTVMVLVIVGGYRATVENAVTIYCLQLWELSACK